MELCCNEGLAKLKQYLRLAQYSNNGSLLGKRVHRNQVGSPKRQISHNSISSRTPEPGAGKTTLASQPSQTLITLHQPAC